MIDLADLATFNLLFFVLNVVCYVLPTGLVVAIIREARIVAQDIHSSRT